MKQKVSILLFEDEESQAILTQEALEQQDCVVTVCASGREGLKTLFDQEFDVYLIDYRLPDIEGVEVLRRIRTVRPHAVCVIVTAHGDEEAAVEAMKLGAYDYVVKSPSLGHLSALPYIIQESLAKSKLKQDREDLRAEVWEHSRLLEERNAELRRMNKELQHFYQLKSDLISMITHDLRNPVSIIKEFSAILIDKIGGSINAKQKEYLEIISSNTERISGLIEEVLDMTKMQIGHVRLNKTLVDVPKLVKNISNCMGSIAQDRNIELEIQVSEDLEGVFADQDKLHQVLSHLVNNALKHTQSDGKIMIKASNHANDVEFCISDTGSGMEKTRWQNIVTDGDKPAETKRATELPELTLGLSYSRKVVELHGGRMWLESNNGYGSSFTFTIPRKNEEEIVLDALKDMLAEASQAQSKYAVIGITVKEMSLLEQQGEQAVQKVLAQIQQKLQAVIRKRTGDVVVTWHAGNSVLVLAHADLRGAEVIAHRHQSMLEEQLFNVRSGEVSLKFNVSYVVYPESGTQPLDLLDALRREIEQALDT